MAIRRPLAVLAVALGLLAWPKGAYADPQQQLDLAQSRYKRGLYEEAASILKKLLSIELDPADPKSKNRAEVYLKARPIYVSCLYGMAAVAGQEDAKVLIATADDVVWAQFRAEPFYRLPSGFSLEVSDHFSRIRNHPKIEELRQKKNQEDMSQAARRAKLEKAEQERVETLETMAAEERFVTTRSRWVAMVPFGVGQFQNEDVGWGIFFGVSDVLSIGTAIVSAAIAQDVKNTKCPDQLLNEDTGEIENVDCDALMDRFNAARTVNWASLGTTAALMITGIIEAQVSFEPERLVIRKRKIPPRVKIKPQAIVTPEGAYFGVAGSF